jgi:hypothetical protein
MEKKLLLLVISKKDKCLPKPEFMLKDLISVSNGLNLCLEEFIRSIYSVIVVLVVALLVVLVVVVDFTHLHSH